MKHFKNKAAKAKEEPERAAALMEERRRSLRVVLRMPVLLHVPGRAQALHGMTLAVSEVGAMIVIPEPLPTGTKVTIENPNSKKRVEASVTRAARLTPEGAVLPVEFAEKAPAFWDVFFPPGGN
ncbi:MAG TPA: PilZ domain-containing protein [Candidatus Acidoferrum sp.]|nr:PilZ domain-containing protein [Candidatus Acidoferrum sp.]